MKIKTINLTGEETKAELNRAYAFIEINNSSDGEILISKEPGIVRGNDDVVILPAKNIVTIGDAGSSTGIKEIYISGKGEIQIIGKDFAEHCFKVPASGGGSDVKPMPEVLDFLPYPEGIYGYWDFEHGVENTTWKDIIEQRSVITNEGAVFSIKDGYVTLSGGSTSSSVAPLNITDPVTTIYYAAPNSSNQNSITMFICGIDEESTTQDSIISIQTKVDSFNGQGFMYSEVTEQGLYSQSNMSGSSSHIPPVKRFMAVSIMPGKVHIMMQDTCKSYDLQNAHITKEFGLVSGTNYKCILLSNGVVNVEQIQANLKALEEKYYPVEV